MSDYSKHRPRPLMISKRACVFYLEHVRVVLKDDRIVYLTENGQPVEHFYNIPERNTAFLLLGKGSSLTDAAARRLAESNVMVGFCGSGGSPLFGALDLTFLAPQSEYRPTEYMQTWMKAWLDEPTRLHLGKQLLRERIVITRAAWSKNLELLKRGIRIDDAMVETFVAEIERGQDMTYLLTAEARWAGRLYAKLADGFGFDFKRMEGQGLLDSKADMANSFLDHGNYIAYGYAAVTLNGLGISFALPILHGKTRRGALVFDLADLVKDAYVMPTAFEYAAVEAKPKDFRMKLIDVCQEENILDYLFGFVVDQCERISNKQ
jgi:CRISPR-associated protein Cas1